MKILPYLSILFVFTSNIVFGQQANANKQKNKYESLIKQADSFYTSKEWKKAIVYYTKALIDTSSSPLLCQRLAYSNLMTNQLEAALKYYEKALGLNPNVVLKSIIYTNIFDIYQRLQKPTEAIAFLNSSVDKGFNNIHLLDTLQLFDPFRKTSEFITVANKVRLNAYPCLSEDHRNEFDFWLGEWDVYRTGNSILVGKSVVTKDPCGCSVLENWTSLVSPQTGRSINYYDRAKKIWEQVYVGSGGLNQLYTNGKYENDQMHFEYTATFNGSPYSGNFIFYNQGPDQVRQYQDYTTDGGKTFQITTDLTYKRKK